MHKIGLKECRPFDSLSPKSCKNKTIAQNTKYNACKCIQYYLRKLVKSKLLTDRLNIMEHECDFAFISSSVNIFFSLRSTMNYLPARSLYRLFG